MRQAVFQLALWPFLTRDGLKRVGIRAKFHLVELSLLSSTKWNLAFLPHESASPPPPKAPRTRQLGFLGPWVPMGAPLLPPLLLCPTPEYRPSRSPCRRGA